MSCETVRCVGTLGVCGTVSNESIEFETNLYPGSIVDFIALKNISNRHI